MEPKALPPAKISPAKLLKGSPLIPTVKRISAKSIVDDNRSLELGIVKRQVIQISDLIKTNTILKAKEEERKKKESEKKRFAEREEKLEKPKEDKGDKIKLPSLPRLGFLDRIKKFLFNIFLGYISLRLLPYLPKLAGVVNTIVKVQDTVIDVSGKILNGLISFVDKAYEVHDKTRKFLGNLGGENFTKAFDGFVGAMDKVITASIIAAIAFGELRDRGYPDDRGKKPGKRPKVTTSRGGEAGKPNIRNPLRQRPKVTTGKGGKLRLPKGIKSRGGLLGLMFLIPDLIDSGMLVSQGRGKDGLRTLLSAVAGTVAGIGAYSATIAGAGALGATGVGLPTAIALAVAGFAASSLAGNAAYNLADAALRKMGLVDKDPKTNKPYQYAGGGSVTRGGKYTGPIKRTIQKSQAKRTLKVKPTEVKPGQSVGGKDKIEKIFPEVESKDQTKNVNPLGYMKSSYKTASSTPGLGGLFGIMMKAQLGERPSSADYQSAADGLTAWMQRTVGGGIQRTVGAFAQGGEVDAGMFSNSTDMKNVIAKALQDSVTPKVDDILNDLKKQLELKVIEGKAKEGATLSPEDGDFSVSGGTEDFWTLVAVASREDADPQGSADVAQTIYNRLASGAYTGKTIKQLITARNQYQPTWDYPNGPTQGSGNPNPEWLAIRDAESAAAAAGMEVGAIKKVAANILNPTLQKNARDFIQGRTDFKAQGQGVTGISRSARGNVFGWHYNYKENKIASVPNFGATVASRPGGGFDIKLGTSKFGIVEYITGDKSHPNFELSGHGLPSNYHDHIAFSNIQEKEMAKKLLSSFGIKIGSELRPGDPGYHGKNLAIDIPGYQWGGTGSIGEKEYAGSRKVRQILGIGSQKFEKGGKVHGFTRAILGEKGPEFVIDADSTRALEENYPGFLNALNKSNYQGALNVIRSYASYEQGATIRAIVDEKLIPVPIPVGSSQQSSMMVSIFDEVEDYMASSYKGK
jgi:hypothetical protein